MVVGYFSATFVHLLLGDGWQWSPGQLQSAHNGLKPLEGQRRTVVVHLYYPGTTQRRHKRRMRVTGAKSGNVPATHTGSHTHTKEGLSQNV